MVDIAQTQKPGLSSGRGSADLSGIFARRGFLDPIRLLDDSRRTLLLNHIAFGESVEPLTWPKGRAVSERLWFDLATSPDLIALLRPLLGENIILWGASTVEREPGRRHEWHVDVESAAAGNGNFAAIWIGLENTSRDSGLKFISRSHAFAKTIQEVRHDKGAGRGEAPDDAVIAWAREFDPAAELFQPRVDDGDALIFDGRIWHGSLNRRRVGVRRALLLQYARADAPVFMPDPRRLEWPFRMITSKRPPVVVVSGAGDRIANRIVLPPPTSPQEAVRLVTEVRPLTLPLPGPGKMGWQPHHQFRGLTDIHDFISCHASVLNPGKIPHPPHAHIEEEILIVLDGEAELLIGDGPDTAAAKAHPVGPGVFVYYPAYQHHTLRNSGAGPLTYMMFRWRGGPVQVDDRLGLQLVDSNETPSAPAKPWQTRLFFEGPTNCLGRLHAHYSSMAPGAGYEPHSDPYDVALVVLSGAIETLGKRVTPFGVVFHAAGEPHGLRNIGEEPACYLVFEFHGAESAGAKRGKLKGKVAKGRKPLRRRIERLVMAPIKRLAGRR